MTNQAKQAYFMPEEYLELERCSTFKHEYQRGLVYAMAGVKRNHIQITRNLDKLLGTRLDETPCLIYVSDMKVQIKSANCYYYPDISVSCDERDINSNEDFILHPLLIIEVLSKSTEKFDRTDKFYDYQQLFSLQEYVLVHQEKVQVECYRKQESGEWLSQSYGTGDGVELKSIGLTCPITEIYRKVLEIAL